MKASKMKIKKRLYRNIGYTLLLAFSFYICYKTYQTQRIKKREGFKEGAAKAKESESSSPKEGKAELNAVLADAIQACMDVCPTNKKDCPSAKDCDKDDKQCKEDASNCAKNVSECKKTCSTGKDKKGKK